MHATETYKFSLSLLS